MHRNQIIISLTFVLLIAGLTGPEGGFAQQRNEEVTIIAPYQPKITDPAKTNLYPTFPELEKREQTFTYRAIDRKVDTEIEITPLQPRRPAGDGKKKLYRNFIKAGIGSYLTPYLLFSASSLQNKKSSYAARLEHFSSNGGVKGYPESGFSNTSVMFSGSRHFKNSTLKGKIGYDRRMVHRYGFKPDSFPTLEFEKENLRQRYQTFSGGLSLEGGKGRRDKFEYDLGLGLYYSDDKFNTKETGADLQLNLAGVMEWFSFTERELLGIEGNIVFAGISDSIISENRLLVQFMPYYKIVFDQYRLKIGANLAYNSDSAGSSSFSVYPFLRGEVLVVDNRLSIYAGIRGQTTTNNFRGISLENPFISSIQEYRNTNETFEIFGGLKGSVSSFSLFAEVNFKNVTDLPLYVTDTSATFNNQFMLIYDDAQIFRVGLGAGTNIIDKLYLKLRGDIFSYSMDTEDEAWQRPPFLITIEGSYDVIEKLNINAGIYYIGQRKAKNLMAVGDDHTIDAGLDLNIGAEYEIFERFTAFLKATNLLNSGYQKWYNYPVQGIQIMGGVTYTF
jgi:hypothetical protein